MPATTEFNDWKTLLDANKAERESILSSVPASPCTSGEQLSGAWLAWKSSYDNYSASLSTHHDTMPGTVCSVPPTGPFFDGTPYVVAATASLPATDLSGLDRHPDTGNIWALNEYPGKLFECGRNGNILRTVLLNTATPNYHDLEGLAFVRREANGDDVFGIFCTVSVLTHRGLKIVTIPQGATSVDYDAAPFIQTTKTWEALAYTPGNDTFHVWADRDYSRFVPNGSGSYVEQFVYDPKTKPAPRVAESLDHDPAISPYLFHWQQGGTMRETNQDTGVVVSSLVLPVTPAGKWEGACVEPGTRAVFAVRESTLGEINFLRMERS